MIAAINACNGLGAPFRLPWRRNPDLIFNLTDEDLRFPRGTLKQIVHCCSGDPKWSESILKGEKAVCLEGREGGLPAFLNAGPLCYADAEIALLPVVERS